MRSNSKWLGPIIYTHLIFFLLLSSCIKEIRKHTEQRHTKTHWKTHLAITLQEMRKYSLCYIGFPLKKKKAEGAVHLLVIHCLLAPNPPSFFCFVILKLNSVNICPLPASTEGAENHRKRQGLLILVPGFCCLFSLLGMTWQCCVETEWCPPSCVSRWYPYRQFPTHQPQRAAPWQISWPSRGLQSPSLTRSESQIFEGRHLPGVFLLGCSASAWRPLPISASSSLGFSVPFDWLTILGSEFSLFKLLVWFLSLNWMLIDW